VFLVRTIVFLAVSCLFSSLLSSMHSERELPGFSALGDPHFLTSVRKNTRRYEERQLFSHPLKDNK
jgi:hypothetical protein